MCKYRKYGEIVDDSRCSNLVPYTVHGHYCTDTATAFVQRWITRCNQEKLLHEPGQCNNTGSGHQSRFKLWKLGLQPLDITCSACERESNRRTSQPGLPDPDSASEAPVMSTSTGNQYKVRSTCMYSNHNDWTSLVVPSKSNAGSSTHDEGHQC